MANKSQILHIAVEPVIWKELRGLAQRAGLSLGTYCRLAVMQHIADKRSEAERKEAEK